MTKKVRSLITNKTKIGKKKKEKKRRKKRKQKLDTDGSPKHIYMKKIGLLGY